MKFVLVTILLLACCSVAIKAQSCLTDEDVKQTLARVESSPLPTPNKKLKEELIKMANYLDTEKDWSDPGINDQYENARRALNLLAQESGGSYYRAGKISDLNGVYDQVINDLGKVYSLGYKPANATRDSTWRRVDVSIVNRTDLVTRYAQ